VSTNETRIVQGLEHLAYRIHGLRLSWAGDDGEGLCERSRLQLLCALALLEQAEKTLELAAMDQAEAVCRMQTGKRL